MYFFEDLFLSCEECEGKRFRKEVLEVKYKDKNIHEVLSMSFDEAYEFFMKTMGYKKKSKLSENLDSGIYY